MVVEWFLLTAILKLRVTVVLEAYTEMKLEIRCQHNLFNDHTGHPVLGSPTRAARLTSEGRGSPQRRRSTPPLSPALLLRHGREGTVKLPSQTNNARLTNWRQN